MKEAFLHATVDVEKLCDQRRNNVTIQLLQKEERNVHATILMLIAMESQLLLMKFAMMHFVSIHSFARS